MFSKPREFLVGILFLLALSSVAQAQCDKEDIAFYLEKGFTQEQITQLCSATDGANAESTQDYTPYQQKVIIYQEGVGPDVDKDGFTREEREAIKSLELGGDVTNLNITSEVITYTRKVCLLISNGKEYADRFKACPETDFSIPRSNIKVSNSGKKHLVFGKATVQLEGDIHRTPKEDFDNYPIEVRRDVQRTFNWQENGKLTDFPVRGDFSVTRIVNAFRTLNSAYKENGGESSEPEKVAETIPDEHKPTPIDEKKKKWWNPFD